VGRGRSARQIAVVVAVIVLIALYLVARLSGLLTLVASRF